MSEKRNSRERINSSPSRLRGRSKFGHRHRTGLDTDFWRSSGHFRSPNRLSNRNLTFAEPASEVKRPLDTQTAYRNDKNYTNTRYGDSGTRRHRKRKYSNSNRRGQVEHGPESASKNYQYEYEHPSKKHKQRHKNSESPIRKKRYFVSNAETTITRCKDEEMNMKGRSIADHQLQSNKFTLNSNRNERYVEDFRKIRSTSPYSAVSENTSCISITQNPDEKPLNLTLFRNLSPSVKTEFIARFLARLVSLKACYENENKFNVPIADFESSLLGIDVQFESETSCIEIMNYLSDHFFVDKVNLSIEPRTKIKICEKYTQDINIENCDCSSLHMCKFYLIGHCMAEPCMFGHEESDQHNKKVLRSHYLHRLQPEYLGKLMNDANNRNSTTAPSICKFYNNEGGCNPKLKEKCQHLHICKHFVTENCKFGTSCKREHNFKSKHSEDILYMYGLEEYQLNFEVLFPLLRLNMENGKIKTKRLSKGNRSSGQENKTTNDGKSPHATDISLLETPGRYFTLHRNKDDKAEMGDDLPNTTESNGFNRDDRDMTSTEPAEYPIFKKDDKDMPTVPESGHNHVDLFATESINCADEIKSFETVDYIRQDGEIENNLAENQELEAIEELDRKRWKTMVYHTSNNANKKFTIKDQSKFVLSAKDSTHNESCFASTSVESTFSPASEETNTVSKQSESNGPKLCKSIASSRRDYNKEEATIQVETDNTELQQLNIDDLVSEIDERINCKAIETTPGSFAEANEKGAIEKNNSTRPINFESAVAKEPFWGKLAFGLHTSDEILKKSIEHIDIGAKEVNHSMLWTFRDDGVDVKISGTSESDLQDKIKLTASVFLAYLQSKRFGSEADTEK